MTTASSGAPGRLVWRLFVRLGCFAVVVVGASGWLASRDSPQKLEDLRQEEAQDYYQKWLKEDVVYIITAEESAVFRKLTTDEEREQFIEQFWRRRDPDPSTAINEFKEEHYRRIAYANENFHCGLQGWVTDRGRIYITFGPPDSIERQAEGSPYIRPLSEGGGRTTTFAFEKWFYRHIPGVGDGITIEFVDPEGTNEFKMARHPAEKDALLHVTGQGKTAFEEMGLEDRFGRIAETVYGRSLDGMEGASRAGAFRNPLRALQEYVKLQRPPQIQFKHLEQLVTSRLFYSDLPFTVVTGAERATDEFCLIPLTVFLDNSILAFKQESTSRYPAARVEIYGRAETLGRQIAYEFEDTLTAFADPAAGQAFSVYQRKLPLKPGRYKVVIVLKDTGSEKVGKKEVLVVVPDFSAKRLQISPLLLSEMVAPADQSQSPADPFVLSNGWKAFPLADGRASSGTLFVYAELYHSSVDVATQKPLVRLHSCLRGNGVEVCEELTENSLAWLGKKMTVMKAFKIEGLPSGKYDVEIQAEDSLTGQKSMEKASFQRP
ncbi:MAG TPA: GWxTD domain-containing protein [Acidobacteriota bacterium]|nr:GWxTD domain-containing protein [Acidobacteriota bacterium]